MTRKLAVELKQVERTYATQSGRHPNCKKKRVGRGSYNRNTAKIVKCKDCRRYVKGDCTWHQAVIDRDLADRIVDCEGFKRK